MPDQESRWRIDKPSAWQHDREHLLMNEYELSPEEAERFMEAVASLVEHRYRPAPREWLKRKRWLLNDGVCISLGIEPRPVFLIDSATLSWSTDHTVEIGSLSTVVNALHSFAPNVAQALQKRLVFILDMAGDGLFTLHHSGGLLLVKPPELIALLDANNFSVWKPVLVLLADAKHEAQAADAQGADDDIERTGTAGAADESWPDPKEHTTAKVWHTNDNALHVSTKTDGRYDGQVILPYYKKKPTKQMLVLRLLAVNWPKSTPIREVLQEAYPNTQSSDIKNLCNVIAQLRKKLKNAGCNADIVPELLLSRVLPNTALRLCVAKVHPQGELKKLWDWKSDALPCDTVVDPKSETHAAAAEKS